MKKLLAIVVAVAMTLSMLSSVAFGAELAEDAYEAAPAEEIVALEEAEEVAEEEEIAEEYAYEDEVVLAADTILYVNCDYNSSTEGWGTTAFSNYQSAYNYAIANAKKCTIIIEKNNTISGNTFDSNHKKYSNIRVIVEDGASVGNALSKWDMTYSVTIKPGATLQSARPISAGYGNSHIKSTLTIGEADSNDKAIVEFINKPGISYKTMSIAILYNGKLVANNATIEVGDLGMTGPANFNDSDITVDGIVAFGKGFYSQTMTNSTMTVNGHNLMNENTYYSTTGTLLNKLTMDNSTININDGDSSTTAEKVTIKTLTMKNGSAVAVENEAAVVVDGKLSMDDSTLDAGTITVEKEGTVNAVNGAEIYADKIALNGGNLVIDDSTAVNANAITGNGTISVEVASYVEDAPLPINADLSAFDGNIDVTTEAGEEVDACINENGDYVLGTALAVVTNANGKISKYLSFKNAVENLTEGSTLTIKDGNIVDEGEIVLPANLTNVTITGESIARAITPGAPETAAVIKNTTLSAPSSAFTMKNFAVKGLVFENSNFNILAWGAAADIDGVTFDGNTFKNIARTDNQAAIHFNVDNKFAVKGLTIVNNIFDTIGNADNSAIYSANDGDTVIVNNIFRNIAYRPYIISIVNDNGTDDSLTVENNVFSNSPKGRAQALGTSAAGTDNVDLAINGNIFKDTTETQAITYWNFNNDTTEIDFRENYFDVDVTENPSEIYFNGSAKTIADLRSMTIFPYYSALNPDGTIDYSSIVTGAADAINVQFRANGSDADEGYMIYDIVLSGENRDVINRLNTADFTFELSNSALTYEIIASNEEVVINNVYNPEDGSVIEGRYEFHYSDKDDTKTDTSKSITIGQVKISGYGKFIFKIADATTNLVTATTVEDNIVEEYKANNLITNYDIDKNDDLIGYIDTEIAVPKRDLTINVAFPNAIKENPYAYQNMKITVAGPEGYKNEIFLGDGDAIKVEGDCEGLNDTADVVYYNTVISGELTLNTPYTVTVEGAGYRTVKYTVNMTENKTLNFWNNVKDNAKAVEVSESGIEKYAQKVTFLAGDIVKDNDINVYDLSAVVSYFGEIDLDENNKPEYAKYDLNRDGKIDSKDVAYVLVSWGN